MCVAPHIGELKVGYFAVLDLARPFSMTGGLEIVCACASGDRSGSDSVNNLGKFSAMGRV
jgi:hypothetical protein